MPVRSPNYRRCGASCSDRRQEWFCPDARLRGGASQEDREPFSPTWPCRDQPHRAAFLMWRNRQYATQRTNYDHSLLQVEGEWKPAQAPP